MKPAPLAPAAACAFCRKSSHRSTECKALRRFRLARIARWHQHQLALEAANTDTTNTEFSDLPEA